MVFGHLAQRSSESELMDDLTLRGPELEETVEHVDRVNRLTFGTQVSLRGFDSLVTADTSSLSVMDVGAGSGGLARDIADWGHRRGIDVRVDGIDLNKCIVDYARRLSLEHDSVSFELQNLFDVAEDVTYDVVHASNMLHHCNGEHAVEALAQMRRIADLGVVVADLHRHPIPWLAMKSTIRLLSGNRLVRNDAPLSVARGFTRDELDDLARRAGYEHHCISWQVPFRWLLVAPTGERHE
jgi:2-polyprenyl-3-methyl-5-hydroxy-6-metoxy-1,4-benzoquinol methylase